MTVVAAVCGGRGGDDRQAAAAATVDGGAAEIVVLLAARMSVIMKLAGRAFSRRPVWLFCVNTVMVMCMCDFVCT